MRVCHVVPSLEARHGGPSKSVRALCRALARAGHEVDLLTTSPSAPKDGLLEEETAGMRIRTFHRDVPQRLCPSAGLAHALRTLDTDLVHHHALWLRTLHYAHVRGRPQSTPVVISPRGMMSRWAWNHHRVRKQLARFLVHPHALGHASGWHATSREEAADIRALGFRQPACIAANGVEPAAMSELMTSRNHWLAACPAAGRRPTALFYGRFHQKKRVIELIDAWVAHAPPEWLLLLVGIPEDYTPSMLERYAHDRSVAGRIRAFDGSGQPPPYAVASLFLLASHNENFGLAIAEAMAHGIPPLVTDTTPWAEINEQRCGWCVPWSTYGEVLRAATTLTRDDLRVMGDRAREWAIRNFSWDKAAATLAAFYAALRGTP